MTKYSMTEARVFTEDEARRIIDELVSYMDPVGEINIQVSSWWGAGLRWARNRASVTSDQREITVTVGRLMRPSSRRSIAKTNQTDSESLKGIATHIDYYFNKWNRHTPPDMIIDKPVLDVKGAEVWVDETFNRTVVQNAHAVEDLTRRSESEQLMSAGYVESTGTTSLKFHRDNWGRTEFLWGRATQAQCSVTVRHPQGTASSWVGASSFDINKVNVSSIAQLAFEKCKSSFDPVRIEPGRYQTILEPQASATLFRIFMSSLMRVVPEVMGAGPMFLGVDNSVLRYRSKLGLRVIDDRLSIYHDPAHSDYGTHYAPLHGRSLFVRNGVLTALAYDYSRNLNELSRIELAFPTTSYRVSGGATSMEEMISSTARGLLVARLEQVEVLDNSSLLCGGVTRDGLWLIENGVITKAVRNFRWTESPLFAFNNVEQIGIEEQVFNPVSSRDPFGLDSFAMSLNNVVVPPVKVNDFSFTSTIDAI